MALVIVALTGELVVMFGNVITRELFGFSLVWSSEIARLALLYIAFVGGALAYPRGEHICIQVFINRLPPQVAAKLEVGWTWLLFWLGIVIAALGYSVMAEAHRSPTLVLHLSENLYTFAPCLGAGMLSLFSARRLTDFRVSELLGPGIAVLAAVLAVVASYNLGVHFDRSFIWVAIALVGLLLLAGMPIAFAFIASSLLFLVMAKAAFPTAIVINMKDGCSSFLLLAIPFFVLASFIMTECKMSELIVQFSQAIFGRARGGLLQVCIVSMYIFSGLSGAKIADIVAVGTTMKAELVKRGYERAEIAAVLAASAAMGETVPPSVAMLLLGSVTTLSVGALFVAGIIPAAVIAICLMLLVFFRARRFGWPRGEAESFRSIVRKTVYGFPALMVPLVLLGGIISGFASPTEVSSVAVVYALLVAALIYRRVNGSVLLRVASFSATIAGMILFIVSSAAAFSWNLTIAQIPQALAAAMASVGSWWAFLLLTVIVVPIMGSLLEGLPAILILGPLLLPIAIQMHISPLQFGIVLVVAMGIGAFSPPLGVGLYVACAVCDTTVESVTARFLPYLAVLFAGILLLAFVPWFSLALPSLLGMRH